VICHLRKGDEFLLQLKSKGRFGAGFWNAPGGKIEPGERPEEAARREVREETGLLAKVLEKVGMLEFYFGRSKKVPDWTADVFLCTEFEGTISKGNAEGDLKWFRKEKIPYDQMWGDDKFWLPILVARNRGGSNEIFKGIFVFSEDSKELLKWKVELNPS
jgi:8-oxo-dGTP pyrophosphatase MutT (NUDIX family)